MSERTQYDVSSLIAPMKVLLVLAMVVCLLSTLAGWVIGLPVQTALAVMVVEDTVPPSPSPAPQTITDSLNPLATPEPTVNDPTEASSTPRPETRPEGPVETLAEIPATVTPSPTPVPSQPTPIPPSASPAAIDEERWIDVDLAEQLLTAYEGHVPVHTTLVSTGLPNTPTPVGQFRIWIKLRTDDMAGTDYYIEDVPYVMYFHEGYGLHGVTWHGNFGRPMSHGCVNLPTEEAEWLFDFADVGTLVNIHS